MVGAGESFLQLHPNFFPPSSEAPEVAVEVSVLDALDEVLHLDLLRTVEICYGAAHFQDAVVSAGREVQPVHGVHEFLFALPVEPAEHPDEAGVHLGVGVDFRRLDGAEAFGLDLAGFDDPFADAFRAFGGCL